MYQSSDQNQQRFNAAPAVPSRLHKLLQSGWRWCCRVALVQPSFLSYLEPLIRLLRPSFRAHFSQAALIELRQTGLFLELTLKPGWRWQGFIPGQHLQLVLDINGRTMSRTFSISSSLQWYQQQGLIKLTIQQQPKGQLTPHLLNYFSGSVAEDGHVKQPVVHLTDASGDFVLQQQSQPMLLLAAGSGVTPLHAMLSSITRLTQPTLLIYSYRGVGSLLFAESWRQLQQRFPLLQVQLLDTTGRGRLQPEEVTGWLADKPNSQIYLCGPLSFSQYWLQQFRLLDIPQSQIRQESYGFVSGPSQNDEQISHQITVANTGQQLTLQSSAGSLLQDLEAAGLSPAYGCRRGICMQCLCQKQQGLVRNLLTGDISDAGAGQIQLCISQPVSAVALQLSL